MLEFTTPKEAPTVKREPLFALDGKVHTIPVKFEVTDALTYTHFLRTMGAQWAVSWAIQNALEPEGYDALCNAKPGTISDEDLEMINSIIVARTLGQRVVVPGPKEPTPSAEPPKDEPMEMPAVPGVDYPQDDPEYPQSWD